MRTIAPRLERPPVVWLGPDAGAAQSGSHGMLLGVRRADWVDVVSCASFSGSLRRLLDWRFFAHPPWDAVGIALSEREASEKGERLLDELVPGDVLASEVEVRVHAGDRWARARRLRR